MRLTTSSCRSARQCTRRRPSAAITYWLAPRPASRRGRIIEDAKRDAMTRTSGVPAAAAPASAGQQQQLHAAWRDRLLFLQYGSLAMAA